jgi:hypothetical protein
LRCPATAAQAAPSRVPGSAATRSTRVFSARFIAA